MSPLELRASLSLASLFALRMLGLFLILPVFAVHARQLEGGDKILGMPEQMVSQDAAAENEMVKMGLEIEAEGERYLGPLKAVFELVDRAINPPPPVQT